MQTPVSTCHVPFFSPSNFHFFSSSLAVPIRRISPSPLPVDVLVGLSSSSPSCVQWTRHSHGIPRTCLLLERGEDPSSKVQSLPVTTRLDGPLTPLPAGSYHYIMDRPPPHSMLLLLYPLFFRAQEVLGEYPSYLFPLLLLTPTITLEVLRYLPLRRPLSHFIPWHGSAPPQASGGTAESLFQILLLHFSSGMRASHLLLATHCAAGPAYFINLHYPINPSTTHDQVSLYGAVDSERHW